MCWYDLATSDIGISSRLFGILSHSISGGRRILDFPFKEEIMNLVVLLPVWVKRPEHQLSSYWITGPLTPKKLKKPLLIMEGLLCSSITAYVRYTFSGSSKWWMLIKSILTQDLLGLLMFPLTCVHTAFTWLPTSASLYDRPMNDVVEFTDGIEWNVVPCTWLTENKKKAYWPMWRNSDKIHAAVKRCTTPGADYMCLDVRVLYESGTWSHMVQHKLLIYFKVIWVTQ